MRVAQCSVPATATGSRSGADAARRRRSPGAVPSTDAGNTVRSDSCRVDDVADRRAQGGDVEVPGQSQGERNVVGGRRRVELVEEPHPLLRQRQRDPVGPRSSRRAATGRGAAVTAESIRDRRASATVGASNRRAHADPGVEGGVDARDRPGGARASCRRGRRSCRRHRPRSTPSTSANTCATACSTGVAGARYPMVGDVNSGAGSAARSSLPTGVSGISSSDHDRGGHHVRGQRSGRERRGTSGGSTAASPSSGSTYDDQRRVRRRARPAEGRRRSRRPGARRARRRSRRVRCGTRGSSPGSRCGPRYSSVWSRPPPHDVAGAVHPVARRAVGVGDEPLRGQRGRRW